MTDDALKHYREDWAGYGLTFMLRWNAGVLEQYFLRDRTDPDKGGLWVPVPVVNNVHRSLD